MLRLDGGYGDTVVLTDVLAMGLGIIARSRDYALLGRPEVLAVLPRPPAASCTHPDSGMTRELYDCPSIRLLPKAPAVRLLIATHPATGDPPTVGKARDGQVYELFISTLLSPAVTATDLLDLYLHRGSFETTLADEDREQDPDRWCSHTPWGQEFWQILCQWVWNLRLEFGQHCSPVSLRTTVFAEACAPLPAKEPADHNPPPTQADPCPSTHRWWDMIFLWKERSPMAHHNGHNPPLPVVFPAPPFFRSPMGRCFAQPEKSSRWPHADRNGRGPCEWTTLPSCMIASAVLCGNSVKTVVPRALDG